MNNAWLQKSFLEMWKCRMMTNCAVPVPLYVPALILCVVSSAVPVVPFWLCLDVLQKKKCAMESYEFEVLNEVYL